MSGGKIICKECGELKKHHAKGLCHRCYKRKWEKENPEKSKKYFKRWYQKNPDYYKQQDEKYPERRRRITKKWQKNNPKKFKKSTEKWRRANHAKFKESARQWRENNPDKTREYRIKRRVNGVIKKGTISKIVIENGLKYGIIACEKCKKKCPKDYNVDHIVPISKGGDNDYNNLQILCAKCNLKKHTRTINYKKKYIQLTLGGEY